VAGDTELSFRIFGTPGARRLIVVVGAGDTATIDPSPALTAERNIRILGVALTGAAIDDPGTFGSETPAEQTATALADLIREQLSADGDGDGRADAGTTVGLLAYRAAGDVALRAAATLGDVVDRLALVAVPLPPGPLDRDDLGGLITGISAKALIMNGQQDPTASSAAASWFKDHLPAARVEMVPDSVALSITDVWDRVLSHLAPGTKR
jgi:hypothetical protein